MPEWAIVVITVLTIFGGSILIVLVRAYMASSKALISISEYFPKLIKAAEEGKEKALRDKEKNDDVQDN